jgi:hypothetical protein
MQSGRLILVDIDYSLCVDVNHKNDVQWNRFILYRHFLQLHYEELRFVLMSDLRDVVFQRNPFENHYYRNSNITSGTNNSIPPVIFSCEERHFGNNAIHNDKWIVSTFGKDIFETSFIGKRIINVGMTMGPIYSIRIYLDMMVKYMSPGKRPMYEGIDMAVHNYIYHEILEKQLVKEFNSFAPTNGDIFFTVAPLHKETSLICTNNDPFIVDRCHTDFLTIPAVIHQYDRSPSFTKSFNERYA